MLKLKGKHLAGDFFKIPRVAVHESGHACSHFFELMVHAVLVGRPMIGWLVRRHSLGDVNQSFGFCQDMRPDF